MSGNETPTRGHIQINNVSKIYDPDGTKVLAVDRCTMDIAPGEFCVVVGPSGCGKSTLLYLLAGLDKPDRGTVSTGEVSRRDKGRISFILQDYGLFPWKTVQENLSLPLELQGVAPSTRRKAVADMLDELGLGGLGMRYPAQLSGGQRQRVAIVRALMMNPEILLLDEVTASLDPEMVREVLDVVLELARTGMTMLIVTHEMGFARAIADRIVFMDEGRIVEVDPPRKFFADPSSDRARKFLDIFSFEGAKL